MEDGRVILLIFAVLAILMVMVVPKFFNDVPKKIAGYRELKFGDIKKIPDEELELAVIEWIFGKFDESGTTEVSIIKSLPQPCRYFYGVYVFTEEIYNGGFAQCYMNSSRFFAKAARKGFEDMGAYKIAAIVENANTVFEKFCEQNGEKSLTSLKKLYENQELKAYTKEFIELEETKSLSETIVKYIRANEECFGD